MKIVHLDSVQENDAMQDLAEMLYYNEYTYEDKNEADRIAQIIRKQSDLIKCSYISRGIPFISKETYSDGTTRYYVTDDGGSVSIIAIEKESNEFDLYLVEVGKGDSFDIKKFDLIKCPSCHKYLIDYKVRKGRYELFCKCGCIMFMMKTKDEFR